MSEVTKVTESMVTTMDNPFDPFTEFKPWFSFDVSHGYHTLSLLGRVVATSNELSQLDQILANERAVDEIVKENVTGNYKKVTREIEI